MKLGRLSRKEQVKNLYGNALSQEKNRLADLIRLGAYTGARIEEICQIKLDDLVEVDGVFVSTLNVQRQKRVKGLCLCILRLSRL